ncbi:MAG: hypothetical protein WBV82_18590 [Myxococcaceae bacterium]
MIRFLGLQSVRTVRPMQRWSRTWVSVAGALALSACAENQACEAGCPDVSGAYSLTTSTASGQCAFEPYLLPPTIKLEQTGGSGQVATTLIDPVQQLELAISGTLFTHADTDDPALIASFRSLTQPTRQPTANTTDLTRFEVLLTGSVFEGNGARHVSGQLIQTELEGAGQTGCSVSQSFTGIAR